MAIVRDFTGTALQACLDGTTVSTPYYDVFELDQNYLGRAPWLLLPPSELAIQERIEHHSALGQYLNVRQGVVTGDDSVFIIDRSAVPKGEGAVYRSFLPDRQIERFYVPERTQKVMFYPVLDGQPLGREELERRFPRTWAYLLSQKGRLTRRATVNADASDWWRPARMRTPSEALGPKIVCPHVMLTPRFALDIDGAYVVSRSPFLTALPEGGTADTLLFFTGVMNSTVFQWQISRHSHKYANGYNRVEVNLLKRMAVPNPAALPPSIVNEIIDLTRRIMSCSPNDYQYLVTQLDKVVSVGYGLDEREYEILRGRG